MICRGERLRVLTGGMGVLGNEKEVMIYGIVLHGGALEERFIFLDSVWAISKSAAVESKHGGLKKPPESIYIHIHREQTAIIPPAEYVLGYPYIS